MRRGMPPKLMRRGREGVHERAQSRAVRVLHLAAAQSEHYATEGMRRRRKEVRGEVDVWQGRVRHLLPHEAALGRHVGDEVLDQARRRSLHGPEGWFSLCKHGVELL